MKVISYCKLWFEKAMTEPDVNSRLIFLIHGLSVGFGLVVLTVAFIFAKAKEEYPYMIGMLGGSAAATGMSRWMTKKGGADEAAPPKSE